MLHLNSIVTTITATGEHTKIPMVEIVAQFVEREKPAQWHAVIVGGHAFVIWFEEGGRYHVQGN